MALFKKEPSPRENGGQAAAAQQARVTASEAIAQYCNKVADHLEATSREIDAYAKELVTECCTTADNLRQVGELERARTHAFYERIRNVITTVRDIRDEFAAPLTQAAEAQVTSAVAAALESPPPDETQDEPSVPEFLKKPIQTNTNQR
jgi:sugar-specific transcriptional regulator TrmB